MIQKGGHFTASMKVQYIEVGGFGVRLGFNFWGFELVRAWPKVEKSFRAGSMGFQVPWLYILKEARPQYQVYNSALFLLSQKDHDGLLLPPL